MALSRIKHLPPDGPRGATTTLSNVEGTLPHLQKHAPRGSLHLFSAFSWDNRDLTLVLPMSKAFLQMLHETNAVCFMCRNDDGNLRCMQTKPVCVSELDVTTTPMTSL